MFECMLTALALVCQPYNPPKVWNLMFATREGQYLVWRNVRYSSRNECQESLQLLSPITVVAAYCERDAFMT